MAKKIINTVLEEELWLQARSVAVKHGKTMQDWLTDAIILKLKSDGVEIEQDPRTSPKN